MNEDILKIIGARVQVERKRRNMTQEELAGDIGVDRRTIGAIESGSKCMSGNFVKVIHKLEISLDEMLYENELVSIQRLLNEFNEDDRNAVLLAIRILLKACFQAMS